MSSALKMAVVVALYLTPAIASGQIPSARTGDAIPRDMREIYDRGVQYLISKQTASGDFTGGEQGPGVTGMALMVLLASGEDEGQLEVLQGVPQRSGAGEARALKDAHALEVALRDRARELVVVEEWIRALLLAGVGLVTGVPVRRNVVVLVEQLSPAQHVPDARNCGGGRCTREREDGVVTTRARHGARRSGDDSPGEER